MALAQPKRTGILFDWPDAGRRSRWPAWGSELAVPMTLQASNLTRTPQLRCGAKTYRQISVV